MANLEYGIANSPRTVFRIGSTSKQFTVLAIALLAEGTVAGFRLHAGRVRNLRYERVASR